MVLLFNPDQEGHFAYIFGLQPGKSAGRADVGVRPSEKAETQIEALDDPAPGQFQRPPPMLKRPAPSRAIESAPTK